MKNRFRKILCALLCVCTFAAGVTVFAPASFAVSENEAVTAKFLSEKMGLNNAAVCGILANIEWESGFDPTILGDNGTSYGICQWHNSRWDRMKKFCDENGYDWRILDGQLWYIKYELEKFYPTILEYIRSVADTADGAYDAGYYWCKWFERPADTENMSVKRANLAKSKYWPIYTAEYSGVVSGRYRITNKATGKNLCIKDGVDKNGQNAEVTLSMGPSTIFALKNVYRTVCHLRLECSAEGRVLNIYASTVASGKNVTLYDRTDDASQQWFFDKVGDGYVIRSAANTSCVLDVSGDNVCVMNYTGAASQIWTLQNLSEYTISYDANGGVGAPASQTKKHGVTIRLSTVVPQRSGYIFLGWSSNPDALEAEFAPGALIYYEGDARLYAIWQIEPCEGQDGTGHKWKLSELTAPPTCTENGRGRYVCLKCNKEEELTLFDGDTKTGWLTEPLADIFAGYAKTKTQFRYAEGDSKDVLVPVGEGTVLTAEFPAGFDRENKLYKEYNISTENADNTEGDGIGSDGTVRKYGDEKTPVGYIYWHWCSSTYNKTQPSSLYINREYDVSGKTPFDVFHAFYSETYEPYDPGPDATKFINADACKNVFWWQEPITVYSVAYTDCERGQAYDFGEWLDAPRGDAGDLHFETRTLYMYDLSALGHDYAESKTAPTCTSDGYTVHTCRRCSDTFTDSIIKAPGHSFREDVTAPDCTSDGYTVFTCRVCSYTYTGNPTPALGHRYTDKKSEPTCTKEGYTLHTCTACGESYTDTFLPALGHDMYLSRITVPPTCTERASGIYSCRRCDEGYEAVVRDGDLLTEWLTELLPGMPDEAAITKTQYRYVTAPGVTESREIGRGYTYHAQLPQGFDRSHIFYLRYNNTVCDTQTRKYTGKSEVFGYIYWHWCSSSYQASSTPSNLLISDRYDVSGVRPYDVFHAFYTEKYTPFDASKDASKVINAAACGCTYWWQAPITIYRSEYADYEITVPDRTTPWQDEPLALADGLAVETRTLYRYTLDAFGHHYVNGHCTACGDADPDGRMKGDLNLDGRTNSIDLNLMIRYILSGCSDEMVEIGDLNSDGKMNSIDLNLIKRIILGTWQYRADSE